MRLPAILLLALVPLAAEAQTAQAPGAAPRVYACRIGKPSYCYKYGGSRCEQLNAKGATPIGVEKNCQAWTAACLDCHAEIPPCLGKPRPPSGSARCSSCSDAWHACMDKIDARYWPNRRKPGP